MTRRARRLSLHCVLAPATTRALAGGQLKLSASLALGGTMSFIDDNKASVLLFISGTIIAILCGKLYEYKTRLDAAEAKAGDYDALTRRLTEAKSLYYQRERTVAMAQKELVESARKRKAAEAKAKEEAELQDWVQRSKSKKAPVDVS